MNTLIERAVEVYENNSAANMSTTTETETVTSPPTASFPDIAPFPTSIPTAPLLRLSLSALRSDPAESARLFQACKDLGFFYLDLQGDELGQELLRESDALFRLSRKLFDIGRDDLQKYDYSEQGSYYGYKGFGKGVVDRKGTLDRNEFYNVCSIVLMVDPRILTRHSLAKMTS